MIAHVRYVKMTDSFKFAYEELLKKNTQLNAKLVALDQMVIVAQERYAKYIDELIDKMNQFRFDVLELVSDEADKGGGGVK